MTTIQDALAGVELSEDIEDSDLVSDVIVILRLVQQDTGEETFVIANNTGISFITQLGLVTAAYDVIRGPGSERMEDDQ